MRPSGDERLLTAHVHSTRHSARSQRIVEEQPYGAGRPAPGARSRVEPRGVGTRGRGAGPHRAARGGSRRTTIPFDVGWLLMSATLSSGTRTFVSG